MEEWEMISLDDLTDDIMHDCDDEMTDSAEGFGELFDESHTLRGFLSVLEHFLDQNLDPASRGNVFLAKNNDGVSLNLVIGTPFADVDDEINQVNVIIAPTDRQFLGSEDVSMNDRLNREDETEDRSIHSAFDDSMSIL